jgi:hypothetical protein
MPGCRLLPRWLASVCQIGRVGQPADSVYGGGAFAGLLGQQGWQQLLADMLLQAVEYHDVLKCHGRMICRCLQRARQHSLHLLFDGVLQRGIAGAGCDGCILRYWQIG